MTGMIRINPVFVLLSCFFLAIYLMIGSVEDWGRLSNGLGNLRIFFFESLWPPDWSIFEPRLYPDCHAPGGLSITCSTAWIGMTETLKIAFISTVFGMVISLPLSLLAANNISTPGLSLATRFLLASLRSLPSLIWAIFFVVLIGFGPISGILAMTVYTVGYLGKLQYEAIEGMSSLPLEAAEAAGLGRIEKAINIVIPESANDLISQGIFMFEYNVRHGSIIGIVGAGGIGYYIDLYLGFLVYDKVIAYLILVFIVVLVIDSISVYVRSFFTDDRPTKKPTWKSVFLPTWR